MSETPSSHPASQRAYRSAGEDFPYLYHMVCAELATTCGLPATVIPIGIKDGLPVGVQIIGPEYEDRTPLAFARRRVWRMPDGSPA